MKSFRILEKMPSNLLDENSQGFLKNYMNQTFCANDEEKKIRNSPDHKRCQSNVEGYDIGKLHSLGFDLPASM